MKTAEEIIKPYHQYGYSNCNHHFVEYFDAIRAIEQTQKDAWNEAIEAAAENAEITKEIIAIDVFKQKDIRIVVDKQSILKLKK